MSREPGTVESERRRTKGFELYADVGSDGRRPSLRGIALQLGVHLSTVQHWKEHDQWDARLAQALDKMAGEATEGEALVHVLQVSLRDHINTLNAIIRGAKKDRDKIQAIKEFTDIYKKLQIPLPTIKRGAGAAMKFHDDLDRTQEEEKAGSNVSSR